MTFVIVISQPLRSPQAIQYAAGLPEDERKVVLTADPASIEQDSLPAGTEILPAAPPMRAAPSARVVAGVVGRARRWANGGSYLGSRLTRWIRSAEWRLRYMDRLRTLLDLRRRGGAGADKLIVETLAAIDDGDMEEIAVFDLMDLPAVVEFVGPSSIRIVVR